MTSGENLTSELYDLIKSIGDTNCKQEEDKIIIYEISLLKQRLLKTTNKISLKKEKENLIRVIYIEMLGHDCSFYYFYAINLIQTKSLSLKKLGYLICSQFLNENSEFLILMIGTIQKDLQSKNLNEVVISLNCLGKLLYSSIVPAVIDPILNLIEHKHETVRKKTIVIIQKIYKINKSFIPNYFEILKKLLSDKNLSVVGIVAELYYEEIKINYQDFKEIACYFIYILKDIINMKYDSSYIFYGIPAPWIQIKILQILGKLGTDDLKVSEQMYEVFLIITLK